MQKQDFDILDAYNMMEDVINVFYFLFFYFFLQSIYKGIESLAQTQIFKPLEPDFVNLWYFIFRIFDITEFTWFQRYSDQKIRVCGKDSIPFAENPQATNEKQKLGYQIRCKSLHGRPF